MDAHPQNTAARRAVAIYGSVLEAVRADRLVLDALLRREDSVHVHAVGAQLELRLSAFKHVYVVGAGKAAASMAAATEQRLGPYLTEGVVVTKYGHAFAPLSPEMALDATAPGDAAQSRIRVLEAAHPVPDAASVAAGRTIHDLVARAGPDDLVMCLISGGASALMELPHEGISLEDLRITTDLLLRAGAPIEDLNTVRACLSKLKAGGLARAASPARVLCLILSDVLGNPLSVIGSGPCVETVVDPRAARAVLDRYRVMEQVPTAVLQHLGRLGATSSPPAVYSTQHAALSTMHFVVGDLWTALDAARAAALREGLNPSVVTGWLQGEAREVARVFGGIARDLPRTRPLTGVNCYIAGGETTVTVRGQGRGGRSQEIACAAAPLLDDVPDVALLAGGTDGTDGPTDAAGGLAETTTMASARSLGADREAALRDNDSYTFLDQVGGLIKTGPTHSNVGDLVIVVTTSA